MLMFSRQNVYLPSEAHGFSFNAGLLRLRLRLRLLLLFCSSGCLGGAPSSAGLSGRGHSGVGGGVGGFGPGEAAVSSKSGNGNKTSKVTTQGNQLCGTARVWHQTKIKRYV